MKKNISAYRSDLHVFYHKLQLLPQDLYTQIRVIRGDYYFSSRTSRPSERMKIAI